MHIYIEICVIIIIVYALKVCKIKSMQKKGMQKKVCKKVCKKSMQKIVYAEKKKENVNDCN